MTKTCRLAACCVRIAGWVSAILPRVAAAQSLPQAEGDAAVVWPANVAETGDWVIHSDGSLSLGASERKYNHALADLDTGGFVRVRLVGARDADMAVLFCARLIRQSPLRLQAYGFALDARAGVISFLRFDEGGIRDPGVRISAPEVRNRDALELRVWHVGGEFMGLVQDGQTLAPLASLAWSDTAYTAGKSGVFVNRRSGKNLRATLAAGIRTAQNSQERPWLAAEWLVTMDSGESQRIPAHLRGLLKPATAQSSTENAFIATAGTVAALRRAEIPLLRATPGVPFIYRDLATIVRRYGKPSSKDAMPVAGLKDDETVARELRDLNARFPDVTRLIEVGQSHEGRVIYGLAIADRPDDNQRPAILLFGAHHGLEVITPEMVLDAARVMLFDKKDPRVVRWRQQLRLVLVPIVNVDGAHAFWHLSDQIGRKNRRPLTGVGDYERGVDLERNYPFKWGSIDAQFANDVPSSFFFRGPQAASEPETQAMIALAERERFVAAISYHSAATRIVVPYSIDGVANPEPSEAWAVANGMIERLTARFRGKRYTAVKNLYPVDGTAQDWYYNTYGTVAFILEAPISAPSRLSQLKEAVEGSRPAWQYLLDRFLDGPSLVVHVTDKKSGAPIAAIVTVDEIKRGAGERFSTARDTGYLFQYLPTAGTYTVRVTRDQETAVMSVNAAGGVTRVELSL